MSKSYTGDREKITDAILPETTKETPPKKKLTPIGVKFAFLAAVLSNRDNRNKRRPLLTAFDGAVLTVLVDHYNNDRRFSFIGCRKIAEIVDATTEGVANSIRKLKALEIILDVPGGYRNRAQRLAPNFERFVKSYAADSVVNSQTPDATISSHAADAPSAAMPFTNTVGSRPKGKGHLTGAADAARSNHAKARRSTTPSPSNIVKMVKEGRHG
mgnify:CR=1 FL=1|jgi:hypothetical protein